MLTHCFQGLYYLLRHPGFMGWPARRRPDWGGGGVCLEGAGGRGCGQAAPSFTGNRLEAIKAATESGGQPDSMAHL